MSYTLTAELLKIELMCIRNFRGKEVGGKCEGYRYSIGGVVRRALVIKSFCDFELHYLKISKVKISKTCGVLGFGDYS